MLLTPKYLDRVYQSKGGHLDSSPQEKQHEHTVNVEV